MIHGGFGTQYLLPFLAKTPEISVEGVKLLLGRRGAILVNLWRRAGGGEVNKAVASVRYLPRVAAITSPPVAISSIRSLAAPRTPHPALHSTTPTPLSTRTHAREMSPLWCRNKRIWGKFSPPSRLWLSAASRGWHPHRLACWLVWSRSGGVCDSGCLEGVYCSVLAIGTSLTQLRFFLFSCLPILLLVAKEVIFVAFVCLGIF